MNFSRIDSSVLITEDLWAVTLLKDKDSNHASLAIERERNGRPLLTIAHLTGPSSTQGKDVAKNGCSYFFSKKGRVKIKDVEENKVWTYGQKTETWQRSRDKVEKMLDEAIQESKLFDAEENLTPFSIFGSGSIFTKNSKYYKITNQELIELKQMDIVVFNSIYQESINQDQDQDYNTIFVDIDVKGDTLIGKKFSRIKFKIPTLLTDPFPIVTSIAKRIIGEINIEINSDIATLHNRCEIARLVKLAKDHITEHVVSPNNCFTWAREKLRMIDVILDQKPSDIFIAATGLYTNK